tara:strand:+ start:2857 stop:3327 length:471 start_codon:yes stop_codon:yes gene_type:complete
MDEKKLLKYSVDYLSKFDSSKKNLKDILKRKIFKLKNNSSEKKILLNSIERIIEKLEKNNFINDNRYLLSKINYLSQSGKSIKYISNYLLKKGIDKQDIENGINKFNNDNLNWEIDSAQLFAKKKKLLDSDEVYEKKLAKMARAGFSYEICKKILG